MKCNESILIIMGVAWIRMLQAYISRKRRAEGIPVTWQLVWVKTTEIIKSLGMTNVNAA
jgi:hypothetical protein